MIVNEPLNMIGGLLNAMSNVMPITEPGIIYGTIETESNIFERALTRRIDIYASSTARKTTITSDIPGITNVLEIALPTLSKASI